MGYNRHDAVLVTTLFMSEQAQAQIDEFRESMPENFRHLLVGPVMSPVNGWITFVLLPDGSKEGWTDSDIGDDLRSRFIALMGEWVPNTSAVEVTYGSDYQSDHDGNATVAVHRPGGKG